MTAMVLQQSYVTVDTLCSHGQLFCHIVLSFIIGSVYFAARVAAAKGLVERK